MSNAVEPSRSNQTQDIQKIRDDLNRRLAKLTDENWAKDLEIQNLRAMHASEESVSMRLKAECSMHLSKLHEALSRQTTLEELVAEKETDLQALREENARALHELTESHLNEIGTAQEAQSSLRRQITELQQELGAATEKNARQEADLQARIRQLELDCATQARQIEQGNMVVDSLRTAIEKGAAELREAKEHADQCFRASQELLVKNTQQTETFRARETQLNGEIVKLRTDLAKAEKSSKESNDALMQIRGTTDAQKSQHLLEMRNLEEAAARSLAELQTKMEEEFQKQFETVLSENKKFRQMLDVRDNGMEVERNNLKQWQEQLNFFDQHLRQSKETLKKEKNEIMRLAKLLTTELQSARNHAFKDYVQAADSEIARIQSQIDNTSALSPMKTKLEERLGQAIEHRDTLKANLASAQQQADERIQALSAIIKSTSCP
jgi:chromosome segregation ATPase